MATISYQKPLNNSGGGTKILFNHNIVELQNFLKNLIQKLAQVRTADNTNLKNYTDSKILEVNQQIQNLQSQLDEVRSLADQLTRKEREELEAILNEVLKKLSQDEILAKLAIKDANGNEISVFDALKKILFREEVIEERLGPEDTDHNVPSYIEVVVSDGVNTRTEHLAFKEIQEVTDNSNYDTIIVYETNTWGGVEGIVVQKKIYAKKIGGETVTIAEDLGISIETPVQYLDRGESFLIRDLVIEQPQYTGDTEQAIDEATDINNDGVIGEPQEEEGSSGEEGSNEDNSSGDNSEEEGNGG